MRDGDLSLNAAFLRHVDLLVARDFDGAIECLSEIYRDIRAELVPAPARLACIERRIAQVLIAAERDDDAVLWIIQSLKSDPSSMMAAYLAAELMAQIPGRTSDAIKLCLLALSKHELGLIDRGTLTIASVDFVQRTRDLLSELTHPDRDATTVRRTND